MGKIARFIRAFQAAWDPPAEPDILAVDIGGKIIRTGQEFHVTATHQCDAQCIDMTIERIDLGTAQTPDVRLYGIKDGALYRIDLGVRAKTVVRQFIMKGDRHV